MRRLIPALLLAFCCCAPAMALDWHLGIEAAVTDDSALHSRIDFHVQDFAFEVTARHTDYAEAGIVTGPVTRSLRGPYRPVSSLVYSSGLQWQASAYYSAFPRHGPIFGYTHISDVDKTFFAGWRAEFGNW